MSDIKNSQKNTVNVFDIFSKEEIDTFETFFENLKLSKQMRREFGEWLPEIAHAEKCGIIDVLQNEDLYSVINSDKLNAPQKLGKLRDILYNMRYPELSKVKSDWMELSRKINPDKSKIQFKSDPYFEKSEVELKITASSVIELKELLQKLLNVEDEKWNKIIDPFKGIK